jgi:hypothetical protein
MGVKLRKAGGGADSFGHTWRTGKSVVEVDDDQAAELLAIADAGFTVVDDAVDTTEDDDPPHDPPSDDPDGPDPEQTDPDAGDDPETKQVTEPTPEPTPEQVTEPAPEPDAKTEPVRRRAHKAAPAAKHKE